MDISEYKKLLGTVKLDKKNFVRIDWKPKHKLVKKVMQKFKTRLKASYMVKRLLKSN